MTPAEQKLSDVFNACSQKIVFGFDFEERLMKGLQARLTPEEMQLVEDNIADYMPTAGSKLRGNKALVDKLVQDIGDGTIGLYVASADGFPLPFMHVKFIEAQDAFPASAISEKVIEAYAEAIEQSEDHKMEITVDLKRGKVDGIKPSQIPGL